MSPPTKANDDNTLSGIGGRVLKLTPAWTNPTGDYRVGIKRAFDLYPTGLKKRVTQERQRKWMLKQKSLETNTTRKRKHEETTKMEKQKYNNLFLLRLCFAKVNKLKNVMFLLRICF